ncbi:NAD(P)-binding protein [Nocardia vinacea]|nr:NAD(P)-binding protein [Nocardia vinacea]
MVTIIGGGIAGTVLAGALAREGLPATVHERRPWHAVVS